MNNNGKNFKFFGVLCSVSAVVLYSSAIKFQLYRNELYNSSANWLMFVMGTLTASCFTYIAAAMFFPDRFKRSWKWWN